MAVFALTFAAISDSSGYCLVISSSFRETSRNFPFFTKQIALTPSHFVSNSHCSSLNGLSTRTASIGLMLAGIASFFAPSGCSAILVLLLELLLQLFVARFELHTLGLSYTLVFFQSPFFCNLFG